MLRYDEEFAIGSGQKLQYETFMLVLVLSVLTFEVLFIFHPAVWRLREYFGELRQALKDRLVMTREVAGRNRDLKKALVRAEESTRLILGHDESRDSHSDECDCGHDDTLA